MEQALGDALKDGVAAIGLDVAHRRWAVALRTREGRVLVGRAEAVRDVWDLVPAAVTVGIDIPIGLAETGPRDADLLARLMLTGTSRSRVFATPPRAVIEDDRRAGDAGLQELSRSLWGRGVSAQALALRPRIREIDALVRTNAAARASLHEVHPEVSLRLLAGLDAPSKHNYAGMRFRIEALTPAFGASVEALALEPSRGLDTDDVLDALLALWSAERIAAGTAQHWGGGTDAHGIRMAIHA